MTPTAQALLAYALWTMLLVFLLGLYRSAIVMGGKKRANDFNPSGEDIGGFGLRLTRAHANCYENLPIAASVMLYAIAVGETAITDPLAYAFIGARLAQSAIHLLSTAPAMVAIRLVFFLAQLAILAWWIAQFFGVL